MDTLRNTLNDFEYDLRDIYDNGRPVVSNFREKVDVLINKYIERIKNELKNQKYLL